MYKRLLFGVLIGAVSLDGFATTHAEAGERWDHFRRMLPQVYLFEDEDEEGYSDYEYEEDNRQYLPRRARLVPDSYYQPEYLDEDDEYLPRPSKKVRKQIVKKPVAKPAPKIAAKKTKPVLTIADVKKPLVKSIAVKPVVLATATKKPETLAQTKPGAKTGSVSPTLKPLATKAAIAPSGVSCARASDIVMGYGFSSVKPKSCTGSVYAFNAARSGKNFEISVNAGSGELLDVKKVP